MAPNDAAHRAGQKQRRPGDALLASGAFGCGGITESADAHIDKSTEAAMDSWDVLKRAQDAGF